MPRTSEPGRSVSARLLDVLFAFTPERPTLSLAELVLQTGMPHATVRRLALELVAVGALERRPDGRFSVGLRLWQLGTLAPMTQSLRSAAQPFMEDLYTALRQHVQLVVLEGSEGVIIDRLSAPGAVSLFSQVGGRLPLHCSAAGKVLLAHAPAGLLDDVLSGGLRSYTPQSTVDPALLRRQLADARRTGTSAVLSELTPGADSYAARVLNAHGQVVAALSVVVRSGTVVAPAALPSVLASGLNISRALGWRPGVRVRIG